MERKIEKFLKKWKTDILRKPLILYGPKQNEKTFTAINFGQKEYKNTVYCRQIFYITGLCIKNI